MTSLLSCVVATLALGADADLKGLPFGIPPAPEDAVIASVAPPKCLFYVNWAGTASPDPASKSETEKLLAEPEVQEFIGGLNRALVGYLRQLDEGPKRTAVAVAAAPSLLTPATPPIDSGARSTGFSRNPKSGPPGHPLAGRGTTSAAPPKGGTTSATPAEQKPAFRISAADYGDLLRAALTHPTAIFISDVKYPPPQAKPVVDKRKKNAPTETQPVADDTPEAQSGIVVNLGPDAGRLRVKFVKYLTLAAKAGAQPAVEQIKISGETWYRTKPAKPGDKNLVTFGFHGKYFVAGTYDGVEGILGRWKSPPPAWLTKAMEQTAVPRRTGIFYLNLKAIRENLLPLAAAKDGVLATLEMYGLANVDALVSTTGLEEQGMVNRVLLTIDGKPRGLLDMVSDRPLTAKELAPIPRDALLALAAHVDLQRSLNVLLAAYEKAADVGSPDLRKRAKEAEKVALEQLKKEVGIDPQRFLSSVGDTWCIYNAPVEGEFPLCGWTAAVPVRDRALLLKYLDKLCAVRANNLANSKDAKKGEENGAPTLFDAWGQVRKCSFSGHEIYYSAGVQIIAPAVCVTDRELVMTLSMPAMKAYLVRKEHRSLATLASVKAVLNGPDRPAALCYCDTPRLFNLLYPMFSIYASVGATEAQKSGIELDPTFWPSAPAIRPHLCRDIATLQRTPHGLEITCRYCLPTGGVNAPLGLIAMTGGPSLVANFWPQAVSVPDSGNVDRRPRQAKTAAAPSAATKK